MRQLQVGLPDTPHGADRKRATFESNKSKSDVSSGPARDLADFRVASPLKTGPQRRRARWSTPYTEYTLDRAKRYVWDDVIDDVGAQYPQGVTAIGKLFWQIDEESQQEPARFACISAPGTDADNVVKLLLSYWCIRIPSVLISITGGAQELNLEPRLEHLLKEGLELAARSTNAWVITGGTDTGVMKLAGDALHARNTTIGGLRTAKWNTPLIGIAPLSMVTNKQELSDAMPDEGLPPPLLPYFKNVRNSAQSAALDSNHTHFVLVNHADKKGWGTEIEMRIQIETRLAEKHNVPIIYLVIAGGPNTLANVVNAIKNDCPVVLILDSKGCAQAVGEFAQSFLSRGCLRRRGGTGEEGEEGEAGSGGEEDDDDGTSPLSEAAWVADLQRRLARACSTPQLSKGLIEKVKELVRLVAGRANEDRRALDQLIHVFSMQDQRMHTLQTSILNAVVSSCKLRSDRDARHRATARATHKAPRELGSMAQPTSPPVHVKARGNTKYRSVTRWRLEDAQVPWSVPLPEYQPPVYEDPSLEGAQWADPPAPLDEAFRAKVKARSTFELGGRVLFDEAKGLPRNPRGRTGLAGRGLLGKWGPNHAADPIVTRLHPQTNQLQMVAIERQDDNGVWAIPGGFVDKGETVSDAVRREFVEEAGDFESDPEGQRAFNAAVQSIFNPENGVVVYRGYVDDPRTTDHAWIETTAYHFHCPPEVGDRLHLSAGDDAKKATWIDVNPASEPRYTHLYASHREWVDRVAETFASHERARAPYAAGRYPQRTPLDDKHVPWSVPLPPSSYDPQEYTANAVLQNMKLDEAAPNRFADAPLPDDAAKEPPESVSRRITYEGAIIFDEATGRPLNPRGRTGLKGRGILGKWGPNHAVDPIVTRVHPRTNKLQVVVARRPDTDELALPGKFMEKGEQPAAALRAAFELKASNFKGQDGERRMLQLMEELFHSSEIDDRTVYRGYVDDVRNT